MKHLNILKNGFAVMCVMVMCTVTDSSAQALGDVDSLYKRAVDLSIRKKWSEVEKISRAALTKYPDYHDFRLLLARNYIRQRKYDFAREEINTVLLKKPDYSDARIILVNTEIADNNWEEADKQIELGLKYDPRNEFLLIKKAQNLSMNDQCAEALTIVQQVLLINPENQQARNMEVSLPTDCAENKINIDHYVDFFDDKKTINGTRVDSIQGDFGTWQSTSLEYTRMTNIGDFIGRINHTYRRNESNLQFEADAYPILKRGKTYMYLNVGYSQDTAFPRLKGGAELFHAFAPSWEGSFGFRYVQTQPYFTDNFNEFEIFSLTASLTKYVGSYFIGYRHFLTPEEGDVYHTEILTAGWKGDKHNWLKLTLSNGKVPDDLEKYDYIRPEDILPGNAAVYGLGSQRVGIDGQKSFKRLLVRGLLAYENEEYHPYLSNNNKEFKRNRYTIGMGLGYLF